MDADLVSLLLIALVALLAPVISALIPNKLIPETVFLLIAGMLLGPNVFGLAQPDSAITLFSDMGLGFLFLLAGYEINPQELGGKQGRHGLLAWFITFVIAMLLCIATPDFQTNHLGWLAAAIALTTTAFGTLVPILHERGLVGTPIGKAIFSYGTWGEICPILVIALVLSNRNPLITIILLAVFLVIAVIAAVVPRRILEKGVHMPKFIDKNRDTNAQILVRFVIVLLVGLLAVSAVFDLDIVLGAFAAGFILRFILPEGDKRLEHKLDSMGYGFFIPLFFVVSGMSIDPIAVTKYPHLLVLFIIALLVVRALPIYVTLHFSKETREMDSSSKATIALYCTTALPLIVAITSIATSAGAMTTDMASLLVAAGGVTVFLMPFLASLTLNRIKKKEHANSCEVPFTKD